MSACDDCLRRAWLLGDLAGHIERGPRRTEALALASPDLIAAFGGSERATIRDRHARFDARRARDAVTAAGLTSCCPHHPSYPEPLGDLSDPPAALFVAGRLETLAVLGVDEGAVPAVGIVGARRCAGEGEEVAHALGHDLAEAGVCVVSGLALGIDSAAHRGAVAAPQARPLRPGGPTIAVLAGGADVIYPPSARGLYARILEVGCALSEMPPGVRPRKWSFPARNRIIAALSQMTVVVQARERSGSLITADLAMQLGRPVGAVPGPVTRALSHGANALLHDGAHVIRDARDVLDVMLPGYQPGPRPAPQLTLEPELASALDAIEAGCTTAGEVAAARCHSGATALTALTRLELLGLVRRDPAGRYLRAVANGAPLL